MEWWSGGVCANRSRMRGSWNCNYLKEFQGDDDGEVTLSRHSSGAAPTPTRRYAPRRYVLPPPHADPLP
jgi:hypothetical protein